uniref:Cytochrome P450 n=1 Tax=Panagrolaimus davidi TaxID=227884 RepID=A0A914PJ11_9BILA
MPVPILGNAIAFALEDPPNYFVNWRKQFGDIYTFWAGEMPIICINDIKTINEKFVKDGDIFAGRAQITELFEITRHGQQGIIFEEGDPWRTHRRFALRVFRDFGFGKNLMQEKIMDEFAYLIKTVKANNEKGIKDHSIQDYVDLAVGSVINNLLFGFRCSENKVEDFKEQKSIIGAVIKDFGNPAAVVMIYRAHIFRHFPFFSTVYYRMIENRDKTWDYFRKNVEKRKALIDFDSNSEPVDYVEAFLRKQKELEKTGETHYFT